MLRFFPGPRFPGSGSHNRSVRISVSIGSQSPYGVRLVIPCGESETRLIRLGGGGGSGAHSTPAATWLMAASQPPFAALQSRGVNSSSVHKKYLLNTRVRLLRSFTFRSPAYP